MDAHVSQRPALDGIKPGFLTILLTSGHRRTRYEGW